MVPSEIKWNSPFVNFTFDNIVDFAEQSRERVKVGKKDQCLLSTDKKMRARDGKGRRPRQML